MPATAQAVWPALQKVNNSRKAALGETTMYAFKYHRPTTVRQAAGLLAREEEAKLLAGGHTLIPTMKLRLAGPKQHHRPVEDRGAHRHRAQGPFARHRRDDAACRGRDLAGGAGDHPGARASRRPDRRSGGAPSRHHRRLDRQQRSERRLSGGCARAWAPPSSPTSAASRRTTSSRACSRPRSRTTRSSPRCMFPKVNKAGYVKFPNPASRFALVGVFVSKRGSEIRVAVTGAGSATACSA